MGDQITVVGTIGSDPERRRTGAGVSVATFRLATQMRRRDDATGGWVDGHTNWYTVSAYRGLADHALESLQKGHRVVVAGAFKLRPWEANGRQGISAEIEASAIGHDLLWGTTVYRRAGRPDDGETETHEARPARDSGEAVSDAAVDPPADAWGRSALDDPTPF